MSTDPTPAGACLVTTCSAPARADAPMCDLHWLALAAPLQAAVLAKWHGRSTPEGDELARIAAAFGGEIVAVRPLRTDQHQGRV